MNNWPNQGCQDQVQWRLPIHQWYAREPSSGVKYQWAKMTSLFSVASFADIVIPRTFFISFHLISFSPLPKEKDANTLYPALGLVVLHPYLPLYFFFFRNRTCWYPAGVLRQLLLLSCCSSKQNTKLYCCWTVFFEISSVTLSLSLFVCIGRILVCNRHIHCPSLQCDHTLITLSLRSINKVLASKPSLVKRIIYPLQYSQQGVYNVKLFYNNKWNNVVVDDR